MIIFVLRWRIEIISARYVLPNKNYQKPKLYPYTSEGYLTRNTYIIMRVNFLRLNRGLSH